MRDTRFEVSATEFDVLWEHLGLGATPVVLRLDSPGRTDAERRTVCATAWADLRGRGLADGSGPDPDLRRLLRALARPGPRFELRGWWGHSVRAAAAGPPERAALVVRRHDRVTVAGCDSLPGAVAAELPTARTGPGRAATAPTAALVAACAEPDPRRALVERGIDPVEAGLLARMAAGHTGQAQVVAFAPDGHGASRRHGPVLTVLDGPSGRYLLTRTVADDGVEWSTIAPTDDRRLRHRITGLLAAA